MLAQPQALTSQELATEGLYPSSDSLRATAWIGDDHLRGELYPSSDSLRATAAIGVEARQLQLYPSSDSLRATAIGLPCSFAEYCIRAAIPFEPQLSGGR